MNSSEKLLKMLSGLIETGVLTSQDIARALLTSVKFNRDAFLVLYLNYPIILDSLQVISNSFVKINSIGT